MFAVMKTGGKQYRVSAGDVLRVEKLAADAGETVQFNDILMVGSKVGTPLVEDAGVQATVIDQIKGEKVINFVRRRRKHSSKRTVGHRQQLTLVRVTEILEKGAAKSGVKAAVGGAGFAAAVAAAPAATKAAAPKAEKPKAETKAETAEAAPAAAAAGADDLKLLSGVGPALEKKLHEAGVTSFARIAAWTEEDVAAMDEKLSFKGRIEREGWIEQAQAKVAEG
ncbi:MAG: 50S ribosomal protein L21 [Pseudomonadota bacterium]